MSTTTAPATAGALSSPARSTPAADRRRRSMALTAVITVLLAGLLVDLLLVGHTSGAKLWGPITAALGTAVGVVTLVFLAVRGRRRAARIALYLLWLTVAFFGYGGYNDHRLPVPAGVEDARARPPLAPLSFTVIGLAGAAVLAYGARAPRPTPDDAPSEPPAATTRNATD